MQGVRPVQLVVQQQELLPVLQQLQWPPRPLRPPRRPRPRHPQPPLPLVPLLHPLLPPVVHLAVLAALRLEVRAHPALGHQVRLSITSINGDCAKVPQTTFMGQLSVQSC